MSLLEKIYNAFDPYAPLQAGSAAYVNCDEVRGSTNILTDLGNRIRRSQQKTCQLISGHRGGGKTTELYRLKGELEKQGFLVVFCSAVEDEISTDVEYADILLMCTRRLLEELKEANSGSLQNWLKERWDDLKELAQTKIAVEKINAEVTVTQFAKLSTNLRTEPTLRHQIRDKVNPHTPTLIKALNEFIADGKKHLPDGKKQLLVMVDNLDRIAPVYDGGGRSNHESIFLDRSEQLKALDCHVIYTAPISFLYSRWANDALENYGNPHVLPMIMVQTPDGQPYPVGMNKLKDVIHRRILPHAPKAQLNQDIFESAAALDRLCLNSGGHVRGLVQLMQEAMNHTDRLPIPMTAVQRAITDMRMVYRRSVEESQWPLLAQVNRTHQIQNDNEYRSLLFNRCLLEYVYVDGEGEKQCWYDVHPLLKNTQQFKDALSKLES